MSDPHSNGASTNAADEGGALSRFLSSGGATLVALLVVGVVVPGLLRRWLGLLGYPLLGTVVFVLGYATMVLAVWWGWIRPLNLTGPDGERREE